MWAHTVEKKKNYKANVIMIPAKLQQRGIRDTKQHW